MSVVAPYESGACGELIGSGIAPAGITGVVQEGECGHHIRAAGSGRAGDGGGGLDLKQPWTKMTVWLGEEFVSFQCSVFREEGR